MSKSSTLLERRISVTIYREKNFVFITIVQTNLCRVYSNFFPWYTLFQRAVYLLSVYHFGVFFCLQMFGFDKTTKKANSCEIANILDQHDIGGGGEKESEIKNQANFQTAVMMILQCGSQCNGMPLEQFYCCRILCVLIQSAFIWCLQSCVSFFFIMISSQTFPALKKFSLLIHTSKIKVMRMPHDTESLWKYWAPIDKHARTQRRIVTKFADN